MIYVTCSMPAGTVLAVSEMEPKPPPANSAVVAVNMPLAQFDPARWDPATRSQPTALDALRTKDPDTWTLADVARVLQARLL